MDGSALREPTPNPSRLREGNLGLVLQECWNMVGIAATVVSAF
jgi:hypothetical protein